MKRRDQNQALAEWAELKRLIVLLDPFVATILSRGSHDSGIRRAVKSDHDPESQSPPPRYADTTGEMAIRFEVDDRTHQNIIGVAKHVRDALNLARLVLDITPKDVIERARRDVPDCAACGDPIAGRIFYGRWDEKCRSRFRRWVDAGNPSDERLRFETMVRLDKSAATPAIRAGSSA